MDSFTTSPVGPSGGQNYLSTLREDVEEKQRLEKTNFDLKMKVYYLENQLQKSAEGSGPGDGDLSRGDATSLKLQLEERNIELEQRNLLLAKAKSAIDTLKGEIKRLKADEGRNEDLEERVRRLKQANDNFEAEYRAQLAEFEAQLLVAKQSISSKEAAKFAADDRAVRMFFLVIPI